MTEHDEPQRYQFSITVLLATMSLIAFSCALQGLWIRREEIPGAGPTPFWLAIFMCRHPLWLAGIGLPAGYVFNGWYGAMVFALLGSFFGVLITCGPVI